MKKVYKMPQTICQNCSNNSEMFCSKNMIPAIKISFALEKDIMSKSVVKDICDGFELEREQMKGKLKGFIK